MSLGPAPGCKVGSPQQTLGAQILKICKRNTKTDVEHVIGKAQGASTKHMHKLSTDRLAS